LVFSKYVPTGIYLLVFSNYVLTGIYLLVYSNYARTVTYLLVYFNCKETSVPDLLVGLFLLEKKRLYRYVMVPVGLFLLKGTARTCIYLLVYLTMSLPVCNLLSYSNYVRTSIYLLVYRYSNYVRTGIYLLVYLIISVTVSTCWFILTTSVPVSTCWFILTVMKRLYQTCLLDYSSENKCTSVLYINRKQIRLSSGCAQNDKNILMQIRTGTLGRIEVTHVTLAGSQVPSAQPRSPRYQLKKN
jgi:hypothetical protein